MPEHYSLAFRRQFEVGDAGDMLGLYFDVFVAAVDELRPRGAELYAEAAGDWIAQIEASPRSRSR